MVQFLKYQDTALYISDSNPAKGAWWGFVIPGGPKELPAGPIALSDALGNADWKGALVYAATDTGDITANATGFVTAIEAVLEQQYNEGAIIFLASGDIKAISPMGHYWIPLSRFGGKITPNAMFNVILTGNEDVPAVQAEFNSNVALTVPKEAENGYIRFTPVGTAPAITLGGQETPLQAPPPELTSSLWFEGSAMGAFTFPIIIDQAGLGTDLNMGFQVVIPNAATPEEDAVNPIPWIAAYLPLADPVDARVNWVLFNAQLNIQNPNNLVEGVTETSFFFSGKNSPSSKLTETVFRSAFRTNFGDAITLTPIAADSRGQQPARLVINAGYLKTPKQNGFRFAPAGDFLMSVPDAKAPPPVKVLCGMSGTETIAFIPAASGAPGKATEGERLRFVPNMPANVPRFPLPPASPVGPPIDPDAGLLDDTYRTSWATFVAPPGTSDWRVHYTAAPKGAELFGGEGVKVDGYLTPEEPGAGLPSDGSVVFPLLPLSGFVAGNSIQDVSADEMQHLDRQIIGPTRKDAITRSSSVVRAVSALKSLSPRAQPAADDDELLNTTTPTGLLVRCAKATGGFEQLLLSQVMATAKTPARQMGFVKLTPKLTAAFQTADQFLVVANKEWLGTPAPAGTFMPPLGDITGPTQFFDCINIGNWNFEAEVGRRNAYGDYRSVMLMKGVKGKILDIDPTTGAATRDSLLMSPEKWTMKTEFAAPSSEDTGPDVSQLVPLSAWMVDYCLDAYTKATKDNNSFFTNFSRIITDPDWTGILILKAAIADVPSDLAGISAGVKDPSDFFAHHIGIEISQIDKATVQVKDTTSMFGLVYYVDPRYDDGEAPHTVAPVDAAAPEEFTLLTLKVLFENSAVKTFESLAQMVLNVLFGSRVTGMVDVKPDGRATNPDNAVLLEGGVQKNGDAVVYSLASKRPNRYSLANNVLTSVEIDTAEMSTRDDGRTSGTAVSWIGMSGYMNFAVIPPPPPEVKVDPPPPPLPDFDIFSFGPDAGDEDALRRGLNFNNLGLKISVPAVPPGDGAGPPTPILQRVESEITFNTDAVSSHCRDQSLYKGFQLELQGLLSGDADAEDEKQKSTPQGLGFVPVVTEYKLRDLASGSGKWHGLKLKVNLGTPGKLAGEVNLNSTLLLAWADDSGAGGPSPGRDVADTLAMVGIALPGAGSGGELFSLQTVIKLSIGLIQLTYTAPTTGKDADSGGYLLVLNQIALKLLGLLKIPPSGNTAFLLFGNPKAADPSGLGWFAMYNKELPENAKEESE